MRFLYQRDCRANVRDPRRRGFESSCLVVKPCGLAVALFLLLAVPADGAPHSGGRLDEYWSLPARSGGYDRVVQDVTVLQQAPASYWSLYLDFANPGGQPGMYMGLQTDGNDGAGQQVAQQAIASIWEATGAAPGPGASCVNFGGEGVGKSCRLPMAIVNGRTYRYELTRADGSVVSWRASITDLTSGVRRIIGTLDAPAGRGGIAGVIDFSEYFGTAVSCNGIPTSAVQFAVPTLGADAVPATFNVGHLGTCATGSTTTGPGGIGVRLGPGPAVPPPVQKPVTAPPAPPPPAPPPPVVDRNAPVITLARLSQTRFHPTRHSFRAPVVMRSRQRGGTRLRVRLSERADVQFAFRRRRRGSWVLTSGARLALPAGGSQLLLTGRGVRGRLPRGRYRLTLTATDPGRNVGVPRVLSLRLR